MVDGIGAWTGDNQLCITQEGHTPFIGQWTTVTNWTDQGSPYLWWTGPDQAAILQAVVDWGLSARLLGGTRKVGVIAGDRASDQAALDECSCPPSTGPGSPRWWRPSPPTRRRRPPPTARPRWSSSSSGATASTR